jgi:uncharacterized membrane protein YfcA
MTPWVTIAIGLVALLYAAVGHAGATGYTAVMALAGLPQEVIRPTALMLNLVVAAIGTVQFARAGHFRRRLFLPLAVGSVPCAAIGGAWKLATGAFEGLLATVLLVSAARIVVEAHAVGPRGPADGRMDAGGAAESRPLPLLVSLALGAAIGLLSGLTGVGGGVFLTPLLLWLRAAPVKQVAAVTAPFILVNSAAGLAGGLATGGSLPPLGLAAVAAAAAGGLVGSQFGAFRLPVPALRLLMAAVLAVASVKLLGQAVGGR